jgi:hypothetical protein
MLPAFVKLAVGAVEDYDAPRSRHARPACPGSIHAPLRKPSATPPGSSATSSSTWRTPAGAERPGSAASSSSSSVIGRDTLIIVFKRIFVIATERHEAEPSPGPSLAPRELTVQEIGEHDRRVLSPSFFVDLHFVRVSGHYGDAYAPTAYLSDSYPTVSLSSILKDARGVTFVLNAKWSLTA